MNQTVLISIIISTLNKPWETLVNTLESILSSDFADYEIVLVDQNKNDNIQSSLIEEAYLEKVHYIKSPSIGLSKGRNTGIKSSNGSWLIFFDDDAIMKPDTFSSVSSRLINEKSSPQVFYGNVINLDTGKPYLRKSVTMGNKLTLLNFDSICSISLIIHRDVFDHTGLFDEKLGAGVKYGGAEESDLMIRALKKNYNISLLENFTVYHPDSTSDNFLKRESYGMGVGALYRKHITHSFQYFLVLLFKLLGELALRSALSLSKLADSNLRKYHFYYVIGIIKGFTQFSNNLK